MQSCVLDVLWDDRVVQVNRDNEVWVFYRDRLYYALKVW